MKEGKIVHMKSTKNILELLIGLKGNKHISIVMGESFYKFEMSKEGELDDEVSFFNVMERGIKEVGGMVIREYTGSKILVEEMEYDEANLYSVVLFNGEFFPMSKDTMEKSYTTDAITGEYISPEKGVYFREFVS